LSRRGVLTGSAAPTALAAATPRSALANPAYVTTVEQRLAGLEQAHNAFVGLYAVNLETGKSVVHRAQDSFTVCSTLEGRCRPGRDRVQLAEDGAARRQLEDWMRANETSSMRAGLPAGWTSADKTGSGDCGSTKRVGIAYGPAGQRVLLALMTQSQVDDPHAQNLRLLIGELTAFLLPEMLA
jgi:beta-lactamase class A